MGADSGRKAATGSFPECQRLGYSCESSRTPLKVCCEWGLNEAALRGCAMAFVKSIEKDNREVTAIHKTEAPCRYLCSHVGRIRIFQINTYGSEHRSKVGQISQTIQFDEHSARQLFEALKREFDF